ncbi:hypothetical protein [Rhodovulum kholense]|uniref:Trimethylamine-N-oxide reductase cytochrome c-type subunit TorC n=1 Tax=Rhodovulum kholense TaxID=453584 RepID=A0A8E3ARU6_9RHOB|nr:hypothetical protein [Rhodovulum kholense]PTW51408.1 trimethylamine-N-oxide reductase cytochrome c-type subunit TorC [Rhodovulum kholense]
MHAIGPALLAAFIAAGPATAQEASLRWLTASAPIRTAPDEAAPAGEVLVASPVHATGRIEDGRAEILVPGWTDAERRALFATAAPSVTLAEVPGGLTPRPAAPGEAAPEGWSPVALRGWVDAGLLASDPADLWSAAFTLYRTRCTACHPRRVPGKYSMAEWQDYFRQMGPRTRLPQDDQYLIRAWLQHNADDAADLEAAVARIAAED